MEEIYINKIIPISTVDGIGARVSIFTQGCNINCLYCHNPETIKMNKEDLEVCTLYNAKTLFEHIKPYLIFTRGITVSGGECMLHPNFLYELFQLIKKEGKTCFVDSNGTISFSKYKDLTSLIDGVLLDIKAWDKDVFYKLTGSLKNDSLIDNLTYLSETDKIQELRLVCIEDYVDVYRCIDGIKNTIPNKYENIPLKLIRFRNNGVIGELANNKSPDNKKMQEYLDYARSVGFKKIVIT